MLQKIDKDRLDTVLAIIKTWEIKFPQTRITKETGFSKGQVSTYLNGKEAMSQNFYQTFIEKFADVGSKPDPEKELLRKRVEDLEKIITLLEKDKVPAKEDSPQLRPMKTAK